MLCNAYVSSKLCLSMYPLAFVFVNSSPSKLATSIAFQTRAAWPDTRKERDL